MNVRSGVGRGIAIPTRWIGSAEENIISFNVCLSAPIRVLSPAVLKGKMLTRDWS
jgi:hypothetical protein